MKITVFKVDKRVVLQGLTLDTYMYGRISTTYVLLYMYIYQYK